MLDNKNYGINIGHISINKSQGNSTAEIVEVECFSFKDLSEISTI